MKTNKQKNEAFLFEQIDSKGDLGFDYADIQSRLNVSSYEKSPTSKASGIHFQPQALAVAFSLLLIATTVGIGGFIMSRRGAVNEPDTTVSGETIPTPDSQPHHHLPNLYPEDILLWQGDVYIRTDLTVMKDAVGEQLGQVMSELDSGSQHNLRDNPQIAIADHLEDGTPFHQITDEENYIAVYTEDNYVIYQRQLPTDTKNH